MAKQETLFPVEDKRRDRLHDQLVKLGDMIGDGLADEPDGRWIKKEYRKVFNALYPEHRQEQRKRKALSIDKQLSELLARCKCKRCGGGLKQSRKGSKVAYCINTECKQRHKAS